MLFWPRNFRGSSSSASKNAPKTISKTSKSTSKAAPKKSETGNGKTVSLEGVEANKVAESITKPSDLKGRELVFNDGKGHRTLVRESKDNPDEFETEHYTLASSKPIKGSMNIGAFKNEMKMTDPSKTEVLGETSSQTSTNKPLKFNGKVTKRLERRWKEAQKGFAEASEVVRGYQKEIDEEKAYMKNAKNGFVRQAANQTIEQLEKEKRHIEKEFID